MSDKNIIISELPTIGFNGNAQFIADDVDTNEQSGYKTNNHYISAVGNKIINGFSYVVTDPPLETIAKTPVGAINEIQPLLGKNITAILEAGNTSLVINDPEIDTNKIFDFYGLKPSNVVVAAGSITMTFEEQEQDSEIRVIMSNFSVILPDNSARFNHAEFAFDDSVHVDFYIDIPAAIKSGAYAVISTGGSAPDNATIQIDNCVYSNTSIRKGYKIRFPIRMRNSKTAVTLHLYDSNDNLIDIKDKSGSEDLTISGVIYSISNWVEYIQNVGNNYDNAFAAATEEIATFFNYLYNSGSYTPSAEVDAVTIGNFDSFVKTEAGTFPTEMTFYNASISFGANIRYSAYFRVGTNTPANLTFEIDGEETTPTKSGSYRIVYQHENVKNYRNNHIFSVSDGINEKTETFSLMYAAKQLMSSSANNILLAKNIYIWNLKALSITENTILL